MGSFWSGAAHLLTSLDQICFLVGLAIWISFLDRRLDARVIGLVFAGIFIGAAADPAGRFGLAGMIAALMAMVGLAGAARMRIGAMPVFGLATIGGLFGGAASASGATGLSLALFSLGSAIAGASVLSYGLLAARRVDVAWGRIALRAGASWIARGGLDAVCLFRVARSRIVVRLFVLFLFLMLGAGTAQAHLASDSYLRVEIGADGAVRGQWDIALRDLDVAVGLDADQDGKITWGELHAREKEVEAYALGRLTLQRGDTACKITPAALMVDNHAGYAYAVLPFTVACATGGELSLRYRLLFDIDPSHRGLLTIVDKGQVSTAVLTPDQAGIILDRGPTRIVDQIAYFVQLGFNHILLGYDHLLFIAVLLVTAALRRVGAAGWTPIDRLPRVLIETIKTLTAFTLAHAIVLTPAVLGAINVSGRLVQPLVAVTIMLAAIDNLRPILPRLRWQVAFLFGLIHGLSFASALGPMRLPAVNLVVALGSFNLGVEGGQIALALLLVPIAFSLRYEATYRRVVAPAISIAAFLLAGVWAAESMFAIHILT